MPLTKVEKDTATKTMKKFTAKGLKMLKDDGGHFYFVSDPKGVDAALVVMPTTKDQDGAKTSREGRALLKAFKSGGSKAVFCQGTLEVMNGKSLVLYIVKGNAKPSVAKKAFKLSELLHGAVGSANVGLLKGAKFKSPEIVAGTDGLEALSDDDKTKRLDKWKTTNMELFKSFGKSISDEDILEMLAAEEAFENMDNDVEELERLEMEQEAIEADFRELERAEDELQEMYAELEEETRAWDSYKKGDMGELYIGDYEQALQNHIAREKQMQAKLRQKRVDLASKLSISSDGYDATSKNLSPEDKATFDEAISIAFGLISDRVVSLEAEIQKELNILTSTDWNDTSKGMVQRRAQFVEHTERKSRLEQELQAIIAISDSFQA